MSDKSELDEMRESIAKIEEVISSLKSKIAEKSKTDEKSDEQEKSDCFPGLDIEMSRKIRDIMNNFDFDKVQDVMQFVGWHWGLSKNESGIPSKDELKKFALDLLIDAAKKHTWIASGGFRVQYEDPNEDDSLRERFIQLEFVLEECEGFSD